MRNQRSVGSITEQKALDYLLQNGYVILEKNYRVKTGEIDLIAKKQEELVFLEVKYRKTVQYGLPEEAVDKKKQGRIRRTAEWYLAAHGLSMESQMRFDVIAMDDVEIRHYCNAF